MCVARVFFLTHGFLRMSSSTSESWLLSWKRRHIILTLNINETCLKSHRRVLSAFCILPSDISIPPLLASWDTAPWLMAREGKEGLRNSESVL